MNGTKVKNIQPLDPNVSTKIRKDEKVEVDIDEIRVIQEPNLEMFINFENVFDEHSKNSKKGDKPVHYVAIMIVQKLNPAKLIDDILAKQVISEGQSEYILPNFD